MNTRWIGTVAVLYVAWCAAPVAAQVAASGFHVESIPTPQTVQGDVVRAGGVLLVGQGAFGPGLQSIVRLNGGATTIADGFGGLGGFSLGSDGTLYVVDNCFTADFGCAAATTGDTIYAIPDALTRTTPIAAADAELLPAGSIPFAFDVLATAGRLLVSDAAGPGAGRVVEVVGGATVDVVTGLGFAAGLALDGETLIVGDLDGAFIGSLSRYTLDGIFLGALASGLSGTFGVDFDPLRRDALVTGGFAPNFTSTLAAVDASGVATDRATGFAFTAGLFHDRVRDESLVLDFGASAVTVVCPDAGGDGDCDTPCRAPVAADGAKLVFGNLLEPAGDDKIVFKGTATVGDPSAIDPLGDGLRLLVLSAAGVPVLDALVPGGAFDKDAGDGWKVNDRGDAWVYKNTAGVAGLTKIKVKIPKATPDTVKFVVKGKKRGTFTVSGAAQPLSARLAFADGGVCVDATFAACNLKKGGKVLKCL